MSRTLHLLAALLLSCSSEEPPEPFVPGEVDPVDSDTVMDSEVEEPPEPTPELLLGDALTPLGRFEATGFAQHLNELVVVDGVVFAPTSRGVRATELSDPRNPREITNIEEADADFHYADADEDRLLVSGRRTGLRLYRPGPGLPEIARDPTVGSEGVEVLADRLLVAAGQDGLQVRARNDLSMRTTWTEPAHAVDVAATEAVVVVIDRERGLLVASPTLELLGEVTLSGSPQHVAIHGDIAVVAVGGAMDVVDLSNRAQPTLVASVPVDGVATRVAFDGELAAIAAWRETVLVDLSTPAAPRIVAHEAALRSSTSVAFMDSILVVGDWNDVITYGIDTSRYAPEIHLDNRVTLEVDVGTTEFALQVYNRGDIALEVSQMACVAGRGTVDPSTFTVEPHGSTLVELTLEVERSGEDQIRCRIDSNDVDEPTTPFGFRLNPEGLSVGDRAPGWSLPTLSGGVLSLSDLLGEVVLVSLFSSW